MATAVTLTRRISAIFGRPGTGKTTTVTKLLTALIQMADDERCHIRLAAPTGKTTTRLTSSLGTALRELSLTGGQRKHILNGASTLHRLLGAQSGSQRLHHHTGNSLHLDVLVVDEALMADLLVISRLIDTLPSRERVIFLDDRDQLTSVEAGAVPGDICTFVGDEFTPERAYRLSRLTGSAVSTGTGVQAAALRNNLRLLQESYRFGSDSRIGQLTTTINCSDKSATKTIFQQRLSDIKRCTLHNSEDCTAMLNEALAGYGHYLDLLCGDAESGAVIQASNEYRLLYVLWGGPFGVSSLSERIEQVMAQEHKTHRSTHSRWYEGGLVMIACNDGSLGLSSGDIGIVLDREQGLGVWFALSDDSTKLVQPSRLPGHETTWTMTAHKPQGSEFDHVALILPSQHSPVVTRELVYTAVTRMCRHLSLYVDERILSRAIAIRIKRRSGLSALFNDGITQMQAG